MITCGEMSFIEGDRQKLKFDQPRKVKMLIQKICCNYSSGKCVFLDNTNTCPQVEAKEVVCAWFKDAVLPTDRMIEAEIQNNNRGVSKKIEVKNCSVCGKVLVSTSNHVKYCKKCAAKIRRNKNATYQKNRRHYVSI